MMLALSQEVITRRDERFHLIVRCQHSLSDALVLMGLTSNLQLLNTL